MKPAIVLHRCRVASRPMRDGLACAQRNDALDNPRPQSQYGFDFNHD
jgi:hypothetical protein